MPVLLRRIAQEVRPSVRIEFLDAIRIGRQKLLREGEIERVTELAARKAGREGGIVFLMDADDECPKQVALEILTRARRVRSDFKIRVVLAMREFESWVIGGIKSILDSSGTLPLNPEGIRGAKEWISRNLYQDSKYSPVLHQASLARRLDLQSARDNCSSFDKLWRDVSSLIE